MDKRIYRENENETSGSSEKKEGNSLRHVLWHRKIQMYTDSALSGMSIKTLLQCSSWKYWGHCHSASLHEPKIDKSASWGG